MVESDFVAPLQHSSLAESSECVARIIQMYLNNDTVSSLNTVEYECCSSHISQFQLPADDSTVCEVDADVEVFPGVSSNEVIKMIS